MFVLLLRKNRAQLKKTKWFHPSTKKNGHEFQKFYIRSHSAVDSAQRDWSITQNFGTCSNFRAGLPKLHGWEEHCSNWLSLSLSLLEWPGMIPPDWTRMVNSSSFGSRFSTVRLAHIWSRRFRFLLLFCHIYFQHVCGECSLSVMYYGNGFGCLLRRDYWIFLCEDHSFACIQILKCLF